MVAADVLVRGAVGLAERLGIPPLVVGLTVVAFGTSAPELVVSLNAAFEGSGGIAVGNVVGSNIANILLVLGLPAILLPVACEANGTIRNLLFMLFVTGVFIVLALDGTMSFGDGIVLLVLLVLFLILQVMVSREHIMDEEVEATRSLPLAVAFTVAGLAGLVFGAEVTVRSATSIARGVGVSESVIGVTLVALGTSLPELVTALMAAMRREGAVAFGNVIGSNVFNLAAILGITASIVPVPVPAEMLELDMWLMVASALVLAPFVLFYWPITRAAGAVMSLSYVGAMYAVWVT